MSVVTNIPADSCPQCGVVLDAVSSTDKDDWTPPSPGDVSACLVCGQSLVFMEGLRLRKLTEHEWWLLTEGQRRELTLVKKFVAQTRQLKQARWN